MSEGKMSSSDFVLGPVPAEERDRELWLQHAAGFIFFEDMRGYAAGRLDPTLDENARAAALKAIDDTVYGLTTILDGVTGGLGSRQYLVHLWTKVCPMRDGKGGATLADSVDLLEGDGMCMGFHGWVEGDFGKKPVAVAR
jgi:hypothetical protein